LKRRPRGRVANGFFTVDGARIDDAARVVERGEQRAADVEIELPKNACEAARGVAGARAECLPSPDLQGDASAMPGTATASPRRGPGERLPILAGGAELLGAVHWAGSCNNAVHDAAWPVFSAGVVVIKKSPFPIVPPPRGMRGTRLDRPRRTIRVRLSMSAVQSCGASPCVRSYALAVGARQLARKAASGR